ALPIFTGPVLVARGIALVVELLASAKAEIQLDAAPLVMQVQWHQRIAALFRFADQLLDFLGVQQKLAGTSGFRTDMRRGRGQWADVHPDNEDFAVADDDLAFLELYMARADGH